MRDPFVYCDASSGKCYLYGTCRTSDGKRGFDARETSDPTLQTWSDLKPVFRRPPDFWGVSSYWAPEVFRYKERYYLFATFQAPGKPRAVQILAADSPLGPFVVHGPEPITSPEYFSLDGTLYIDKKGDPWMVYSREHISVHDGQMRAVRLTPDLTAPVDGTDILLFKASSAPFAAHWNNNDGSTSYLTDGPQMLRLASGDLVMAWSTNNYLPKPVGWGYCVAVARSTSGEIQGPWVQEGILYNGFAGHGQIFRHPKLGLVLSVHQPNRGGTPYPLFLHVYEKDGKLTMADPTTPDYVQAYWRFEDLTPAHAALPSIDILDSSGKDNHLRGDSFETVGTGSASVPAAEIPATKRLDLACYDNSEPPKDGATARYLNTADHKINDAVLKNWTIEASIRPGETSKAQAFICRGSELSVGLTADGKAVVRFGGQSVTSSSPLTAGSWYNLAAVCDGRTLRLYIDTGCGSYVLAGKATLPAEGAEPTKGQWFVGCGMRDGKPADQFTGLIDEVRISDKALATGSFLFARDST